MATYEELIGSPIEQLHSSHPTDQSFVAVRKLICKWSERNAVVSDLMDTEYPYLPTGNCCYPVQFTVEPYQDGSKVVPPSGSVGAVSYSNCLLTVKYGYWQLKNQVRFIEELDTTSHLIPIEPYELEFEDGEWVSLSTCPARRVVFLEYKLTVVSKNQPSTASIALLDHINSTEFSTVGLGLNFPARSVLYADFSLTRTGFQAGTGTWKYSKTFKIHPWRWDTVFRPKKGVWGLVYSQDGGVIFYPQADLNTIVP